MDFLTALSIVILAMNLGLGFFVYLGNRKNRINLIYFLATLAIGIWISALTLTRLTASIFWFKMIFLGSSFLALFFFYFCYLFPRKTFRFSKLIHWFTLLLVGGMMTIPLFTRLVNKDIGFLETNEVWVEYGPFYPLWSVVFLSIIGGGVVILIRKFREISGIEKIQLRYFLIGTGTSLIIAVTTNLLFPLFGIPISLWQYGPLSLIFFVVFTTYSITKHHLMDLKIVVTELLVGLVLVVLLIDLLLSKTLLAGLLKAGILIAFTYLGISLIKSVLEEIKRREKIEKMSQELRKTYQELKKLDEAKSEFIAMASHQLRTPLSIIKGLVSMALEGSYNHISGRLKKSLASVFNSNERLVRIVDDLLSISKIELGKMDISKREAQIENLIEEVVQELKAEAEKKGLYIKYERPSTFLPKIGVDVLKIRQAIFCIVDNAIKYTKKGGIIIKLKIENEKLKIAVSDTGAGMEKEEISRIFASFVRGRAGIDLFVQGAGLGLYLAKKYVELHKGRIWAESPGKGKGSTFYIELPIT